jgi:hypothetical protein
MRTNIVIDDKLMKQAMKASGNNTKKATVEEALRLLVRLRKQAGLREFFGKFPDLDTAPLEAPEKDKWAEADRRWEEEQKARRLKTQTKRKAA